MIPKFYQMGPQSGEEWVVFFLKKKFIIFIFLNWWLFLKKYFVCGESRKVGDLGVCTVMMRVGSIDGWAVIGQQPCWEKVWKGHSKGHCRHEKKWQSQSTCCTQLRVFAFLWNWEEQHSHLYHLYFSILFSFPTPLFYFS